MASKEQISGELGKALGEFANALDCPDDAPNRDALRQAAIEKFQQAVEHAAAQGVEISLCWQTLGQVAADGKERIGYFSRALDCVRAEKAASTSLDAQAKWGNLHTEADCLFEIGRVHAYLGSPAVAREFFEQAMPLAQKADELAVPLGNEAMALEGRIAELWLQLPDDEAGA